MLAVRDKSQPGGAWRIASVEADVLPIPEQGIVPTVSALSATSIAKHLRPAWTSLGEPSLIVTPKAPGHAIDGSHLAWAVIGWETGLPHGPERLTIDAHSGKLIRAMYLGLHARGGLSQSRDRASSEQVPCSTVRDLHADVSSGLQAVRGDSTAARSERNSISLSSASAGGSNETSENGLIGITGTVFAYRTADWLSDTRSPIYSTCARTPQQHVQQEVRVELLALSTETVLDIEYTDGNGSYSLIAPAVGTYRVRCTLGGRNWDVVHVPNPTQAACATGNQPEPRRLPIQTVTAPASGIDFTWASTSAGVQDIADTNTHEGVRVVRAYWRSVLDPSAETPLDDFFLVWTNREQSTVPCNGAYYEPGIDPQWQCSIDGLAFQGGDCPHWGQQTVAVHEYGHLVHTRLLDYSGGSLNPSWAEGYADSMVFVACDDASGGAQPTIFAPDSKINGVCGQHQRAPLVFKPTYPVCACATPNQQTCPAYIDGNYVAGQLLGVLWIELRQDLNLTTLRTLYGAWSLLAIPPAVSAGEVCTGPVWPESADGTTLIQVLTADDDDGNLSNGTPNKAVICAVFNGRGIDAVEAGCGDSAPSALQLVSDYDKDGDVDLLDAAMIIRAIHMRATLGGAVDHNAVRQIGETLRDAIAQNK